jgi:hypothetical protein
VPALSSSTVRFTNNECPADNCHSGDHDRGAVVPPGLLTVWDRWSIPARVVGVRHQLATVLAVAGQGNFCRGAPRRDRRMSADTPAQALHRLGGLGTRHPQAWESTIRRLRIRLPAGTVDTVIDTLMWLHTNTIDRHRVIAIDGEHAEEFATHRRPEAARMTRNQGGHHIRTAKGNRPGTTTCSPIAKPLAYHDCLAEHGE